MTQYAFYFDASRCTGCKTCEMSCKDYKDLDSGVAFRKIYEFAGGNTGFDANGCIQTNCFAYFVSESCNHCDNPACVSVCPTGAMHKDEETGLVLVDEQRCIGCGYCHMACPYNAPMVDKDKGHSVKCDGCIERIAEGRKPVCVEACPARALDFGSVEEMEVKGDRANIMPLPPVDVTTPNLFVKSCDDACPAGTRSGKVVNPLEVL